MDTGHLVHEEWSFRLVPSTHGKDIFYRVFLGTVNWDRSSEGLKTAYTIFMQYGKTEDWNDAKMANEIDFKMPPHILEEDLGKVLAAIEDLKEKRKQRKI